MPPIHKRGWALPAWGAGALTGGLFGLLLVGWAFVLIAAMAYPDTAMHVIGIEGFLAGALVGAVAGVVVAALVNKSRSHEPCSLPPAGLLDAAQVKCSVPPTEGGPKGAAGPEERLRPDKEGLWDEGS